MRRTKQETKDFHIDILNQVSEAGGYLTIRHLFYRLVSAGTIEKTERAYRQVYHHTKIMRQERDLPYDVFADNSRLRLKSQTFNGPEDALRFWARNYRRELWATQDCYVEIWSEKDAISNIVVDITDEYNVPLLVARGFSSLTFLYLSAQQIKRIGKPTFVYHLGDHDPSGVKAAEDIRDKLKGFGCNVYFERLAITEDQIDDYALPTRPTKQNTHSKGWEGDSVEIDAMDPRELQEIVRNAIELHIDEERLIKLRDEEELQRETLMKMKLPNYNK